MAAGLVVTEVIQPYQWVGRRPLREDVCPGTDLRAADAGRVKKSCGLVQREGSLQNIRGGLRTWQRPWGSFRATSIGGWKRSD